MSDTDAVWVHPALAGTTLVAPADRQDLRDEGWLIDGPAGHSGGKPAELAADPGD
jgi:hypothetical protein